MQWDTRTTFVATIVLLLACLSLAGCRSAYYDAWESFGVHKRDILRDRVEAGQEEQEEAREQFQTAYERFKEAAGYGGGELEDVYLRLQSEYDESEEKAQAVRDRIDSIEQVADDLFEEWRGEIELIQRDSLRRQSQQSLRDTKARYEKLIAAMKRAEAKMDPVLTAFRDQVLFLKHNLNARAIASLEGTVGEIENDVAQLIGDIDVSIKEAERFIESMPS
jgi:DNA repair exonuclease SbcCD ATPase subunit